MVTAAATGDVADHPASAVIFDAWRAEDHAGRRQRLGALRSPGPIALRSRYCQLLDPLAPPGPWNPDWSVQTWNLILRLESDGDQAIIENSLDRAKAAFGQLLTVAPAGNPGAASDPLVVVHGHVGLGDVGLAADDPQAAASEYEAALAAASSSGYRFGQLRALVGVGYVTLMYHSAGAAVDRFTEAVTLARALDDPVYEANAALGLAECQERLANLDQAIESAKLAYLSFERCRAVLGMGNAAQRLGAMLHRARRNAEADGWLTRAHAAFEQAGNPMGLTNVLGSLGDLRLEGDDLDGAQEAYLASLQVAQAAGLRRSRAHALQSLGRVASSLADWEAAISALTSALDAYTELDDPLGMSNAYDRLARVHAQTGQLDEALRARMSAIYAIESFRATHSDERSQREYRDRFRIVYAAALATATACGSASSFAVAADCLAGRRLAGLFAAAGRSAPSDELTLLQELAVRADQRLVSDQRNLQSPPEAQADGAPGDPPARRERVIRLLGAMGIKYGLADRAEASLDDLLSTVYLPPQDEGDGLLAALPQGTHVLQVLIDPMEPMLVRWLWRSAGGAIELGASDLPEEATSLLAVLQGNDDDRVALRISDLDPLAALLPEGLRAAISQEEDPQIIVIPVGALWFVPWAALAVSDQRVLGESACYVLCPSLTVQRMLAFRTGRTEPAGESSGDAGRSGRPVDVWRSPFVLHHRLDGVLGSPAWNVTRMRTAADAKRRLRQGAGTMVVAGHGRTVPGLGHYLELDRDEWLLPADLIGAAPPDRLAVIACWGGAIPGRDVMDPVSLATLALAAGSTEIAATIGELADLFPAVPYVDHFLAELATTSIPMALHRSAKWALDDEALRSGRIYHWAPLAPFGTFR